MSQFGKNSAKVYHCLYSSTEQLQVALLAYMFLKFGLNNKKSLHTLPLLSVPFYISPSLSLPLQTLRLVSLVSLIIKTLRIAERSATNCDTHTHTQTKYPRQIYDKLVGFGRACALRAPVFLGTLSRPTGRCAPPPPAYRSFAAP